MLFIIVNTILMLYIYWYVFLYLKCKHQYFSAIILIPRVTGVTNFMVQRKAIKLLLLFIIINLIFMQNHGDLVTQYLLQNIFYELCISIKAVNLILSVEV